MAKSETPLDNGFEETPIGLIPEDWEVSKLKEISDRKMGTLDPNEHQEEVFDYYSIPAYQEAGEPILEIGDNIGSRKLVPFHGDFDMTG